MPQDNAQPTVSAPDGPSWTPRGDVACVTVEGIIEADGSKRVEDPEDVRRRRRLLEEWDRFDAMPPAQQQAYQALGAKRGREATGTVEVVRRTPQARPAARRPRASTTRSSRGSPDDDPGDGPEPGDARPADDLAATRRAVKDALRPERTLWARVRAEAARRTEELRRRG